ncbi:4300_t:CDS:2 [Paraglomus brasilianum]|uniref:4300_t:CDS:1 n=1 Tax=Paraglomus brasilianum TaxID=144538 RepID=A0A9N9E0G9_9GLOM|nr:4300_t:CDS:2 [Paraglomus brasilianum]
MNDEIKLLLVEGICVHAGKSYDAIIIQCGAPILSSMMLSRILNMWPAFAIPEPPQETNSLDNDWLLRHTIKNLSVQHIFAKQMRNVTSTPSEYSFQAEFVTVIKHLLEIAELFGCGTYTSTVGDVIRESGKWLAINEDDHAAQLCKNRQPKWAALTSDDCVI